MPDIVLERKHQHYDNLQHTRLACLPASVNPCDSVIQLLPDHQPELKTATPEACQEFWHKTFSMLDKHLERASRRENTFARHLFEAEDVDFDNQRMYEEIIKILNQHEESITVGLLYGIVPHLAGLYSSIRPNDSIRDRIFDYNVPSTNAASAKNGSEALSLSDRIKKARYVIIFDEVLDTGRAAARIVESLRTDRTGYPYDPSLPDALGKTFGTPFENYKELYTQLIAHMEETGVVLAISYYKNKQFTEQLLQYAAERDTAWSRMQTRLLGFRQEFEATEWLMGEGLDTGMRGELLYEYLPKDIKRHTELHDYLEYLKHAKVRVGSTIEGLIALKNISGDEQWLEDFEALIGKDSYQFNTLKTWYEGRRNNGASLQSSEIQFHLLLAWAGYDLERMLRNNSLYHEVDEAPGDEDDVFGFPTI